MPAGPRQVPVHQGSLMFNGAWCVSEEKWKDAGLGPADTTKPRCSEPCWPLGACPMPTAGGSSCSALTRPQFQRGCSQRRVLPSLGTRHGAGHSGNNFSFPIRHPHTFSPILWGSPRGKPRVIQPQAWLGPSGEGVWVLDPMPRGPVTHGRAGAMPGPAEPPAASTVLGGLCCPHHPHLLGGFCKTSRTTRSPGCQGLGGGGGELFAC